MVGLAEKYPKCPFSTFHEVQLIEWNSPKLDAFPSSFEEEMIWNILLHFRATPHINI